MDGGVGNGSGAGGLLWIKYALAGVEVSLVRECHVTSRLPSRLQDTELASLDVWLLGLRYWSGEAGEPSWPLFAIRSGRGVSRKL